MRLTVHSWSWDRRIASGSRIRAASPRSPGREHGLERHLDIRETVTVAIAYFLRSHRHPEGLRLGPARGQDVHVDRRAAPDRGEQQLNGGEVGVATGADGDPAAPVVGDGERAGRDPVDGYRALCRISRHGVDSARPRGSHIAPGLAQAGSPAGRAVPVQPAEQVRPGQLGRPLMVVRQFSRAELLTAGPRRAAPEERPAVPDDPGRTGQPLGVVPHGPERGRPHQAGPDLRRAR